MIYRFPTDLETRLSARLRQRFRKRFRPRRSPAPASWGRLFWVNGTLSVPPYENADWYLRRLGVFSPWHRPMTTDEVEEIGAEVHEEDGGPWVRIGFAGHATEDRFAELVHALDAVAEDIGTGGSWGLAAQMGKYAYCDKQGQPYWDQPAVSFRDSDGNSADLCLYVTPTLRRPGGPRDRDFEDMRAELLRRYGRGR